MKITHQIDRGGRTGIIKGRLESVAMHGPSGPGGDGLALGFPPIVYDSAGLLKAADGTSDYTSTVAVPGTNKAPPDLTLTILYGGKEVFVRTFSPVLLNPGDDHLNLNEVFARGGDVAVTPTQLLALGTGLADLDTKKARADADHAASLQALADTAQSQAALAALANSVPYANRAAFPIAATATKSAIALDTGAIYTSNGATWGSPLGYVTTKAAADALSVRLGAVELGQAGGTFGYTTLAAMNADLVHPAGALARVTNDATSVNNGDYIKLGASGAGSWQPANNSRLALAEGRVASVEAVASKIATLSDSVQTVGTNGPQSNWQSESSTFSGWGGPVGPRAAFNRITVRVKPFDAASPITSVRVVVRATDQSGALLAEKTVTGLTIPTGTIADVVADLPALVDQGATPLYIEYFANGKTGLANVGATLWPSASGYPTVRYAAGSGLNASTQATSATYGVAVDFKRVTAAAVLTLSGSFTSALDTTYPGLSTSSATLAQIGTTKPAVGSLQVTGTPVDQDSNASTFSGWGSPVGVRQPFNYISFVVNPWDATSPVTKIRLRIRENDSAGAVLYDGTQDVTLTPGTGAQNVEVYLPQTISTATPLYVEYFANGKTGRQIINAATYPVATFSQARYTTTRSVTDTTLGAAGGQFNLAYTFGLTTGANVFSPKSDFVSTVNPAVGGKIQLVPFVYGVIGREMNVYYENVINTTLPQPLSHYWVDAVSAVGKEQNERWTWTPTAAGSANTLGLNLSYGGQKISGGQATIRVAAADAGAGVTRKILIVGDSTTEAGVYAKELKALADGNAGLKLALLGTRPGITNGYTDVMTEGYSGKTAQWLYSDSASPFTFNGADPNGTVFSFSQYLSATGQSMSSDDWVTVHVGINDVFGAVDDTTAQAAATQSMAAVNAMIANIQSAGLGLRIAVLETIPPSADQDAFGASYGSNYNRAHYRRNRDILHAAYLQAFAGREGSKVYLVAFGTSLDTRNNMYRDAAAPINSRNAATSTRQSNGLHPAVAGYQQMADALFAFLKFFP